MLDLSMHVEPVIVRPSVRPSTALKPLLKSKPDLSVSAVFRNLFYSTFFWLKFPHNRIATGDLVFYLQVLFTCSIMRLHGGEMF